MSVLLLLIFLLGTADASLLQYYFGRRGGIFITSLVTGVACFWQGFTNFWQHLLIARFFMVRTLSLCWAPIAILTCKYRSTGSGNWSQECHRPRLQRRMLPASHPWFSGHGMAK